MSLGGSPPAQARCAGQDPRQAGRTGIDTTTTAHAAAGRAQGGPLRYQSRRCVRFNWPPERCVAILGSTMRLPGRPP